MTVQIANTELTNNFNTWRLNTNLIATAMSNNTITIRKSGRGGLTVGSGHVYGNLSSSQVSTNTITGGWYSVAAGEVVESNLRITSNTFIGGDGLGESRNLLVRANTVINGSLYANTSAGDIFYMSDVSRIRMTGGNPGEYLRKLPNDQVDWEPLTLRQVKDLSSNSAHLILSGANTSFSNNGDSVHLVFGSGLSDYIHMYLAKDAIPGRSDLFVNLADAAGESKFIIADSSNAVVGFITSDGDMDIEGTLTASGALLPSADDTYDLGSSGAEWKDLYIDGVANIDELNVATGASQGVSSSLIPKTDAIGNLGSSTRKWGTVWADTTNGGAGVFSTLGVSGALTANGNVTLGNADTDTITVKGKFANLAVTGVASFNGTTNFNGTMNINGNVNVGDQAADTLTVTSTAALNGNITLGDASTDTITVKGNFANQHTTGVATFGDVVGIATPTVAAGYVLEADGKSYIHDDALFANNVIIHGGLQIDGAFTLPSGATLSSQTGTFQDLTVTNDATIGNDATDIISITGATTITGNVDLNGALDVSNEIKNDSTVLISKNGKIHANNAITSATIRGTHLENSGVTAASYGGASSVPVITVDAKGRITSATTTTVAGVSGLTYTQSNNNIRISTATGKTYDDVIDAATTTSGTGRGVASFDTNGFSLSSGHVSLKNATTGAVLAINGTSKEVNVSRTNGTVTIGLPDDVSITSDLTVGGGVFISGNLTVSGTTTTVNTETVNIADNLIVLNSNYTGASPTENGGIAIERGTQTNKQFIWNETRDLWEVDDDFQTQDQLLIQRNTGGVWRGIAMRTSNTVSTNNSVIYNNRNELKIESDGFVVKEYSGTEKYIECTDDGSVDLYYNGSKKLETSSTGVSVTGNLTTSGDITVTGGDIVLSGTGRIQGVDTVSASTDAANKKYVDNMMSVANTQALVGARLGATATVAITGAVAGGATAFSGNTVSIAVTQQNNSVTLGTHTTGNYVATITAGDGIDTSGAATGEGIAHSISLEKASTSNLGGAYFDANNFTVLSDGLCRIKDNGIALGTETTGNYMSGVTAGSGISVTHTPSEGSSATIAHSDTSTLSGSYGQTSTEDGVYVKSVTVDGFGHLTAVTTDDFDDRYLGISAKAADSQLLDGVDSTSFLRSDAADHKTSGYLYMDDGVQLAFGTGADALVWYDATSNEVQWNMATTTGIDFQVLGTSKITFTNTGNITVTGTLIESSDQRLKSDIQPITNAVDKVMALGGYTYNKEGNDTRRTGVIAQEVLEVLPEAVTQSEETGYYNVAYGNMVGLLIEAIKEQQKQIEELKAKLV